MNSKLPSGQTQPRAAWISYAVVGAMLFLGGIVSAQPILVSEIPTSSKNFTFANGSIYFSAGDNLYKANATSSPVLVKTMGQEIIRIYDYSINASFFFLTQSAAGHTLWRSDGTAANTQSITTQPQITPLRVYNGNLFLKVNSSVYGNELWKVDGAFTATLVKDINPGTGSGYTGFDGSLVEHKGLLYFFANAGSGQDLWKSNGTTAGTVVSVDFDSFDLPLPPAFYELTSVNDFMFFTQDYEAGDWGEKTAELWKTDGTAAGTTLLQQYSAGYSYNFMSDFKAFNGKLYFFHNIDDPIYTYFSESNGLSGGTRHIDLTTVDGYSNALQSAGTHLVYYANSQGFNTPIEKWDGSTVSNVHTFSMYNSEGAGTIDLTTTHGRAFFIDDYYDYGGGTQEIWQADLTTGQTKTLMDLYGPSYYGSRNITAADQSIYFTRLLPGNKMTLWFYNPDSPPTISDCASDGFIERERWNNVSGYAVSSIPVNSQPNAISVLPNFSAPTNEGDNYGARIRGYVCAPETGNYVFYISGDDNSELWLSTDDDPANKRLIASSKWTNPNQWDKYATQQSTEIALIKGQRYYIEALHKEAAGADHLAVGWKLPNGTLERPIAGKRLSPFPRNIPPTITIYEPRDNATFMAPATIPISAYGYDNEGPITKVGFYNAGTLLYEDSSSPFTYNWENVPAGTYTIEARATDNGGFTSSDFQTVTVSPGCNATGIIYQEIWVNATGTDVRTFDFSTRPNSYGRSFSNFETTQYYANNYASRMRGYVCVPQTGTYTFWISSDDSSELYLSTDDTEGNKKLIAWVYGATQFKNYDKYPSQKSVQVTLQAGYRYYIEARHKEGTGNDFISVGWQLPDGTLERPIAGNRIIGIEPQRDQPTDITITSPQPNQNFTTSTVKLAATVTDPDGVDEVRFTVHYGNTSTEVARFTAPPYEYNWTNVPPGSYQLNVAARDGASTTVEIVFFSVENTPCQGTGTIIREIWTGIPGTSVSAIPVSSAPNRTVTLTSFATPNYYGNDYGSRIRGYVCAPASGNYTFWISGDDNSELWIADSDAPSTKQRIAYVSGSTSVNQWDKYRTQQGRVNLVQGQRYYIEVLHKEGNGADHVEVGWQIPNGALERPIPGNRLIPFEDAATSASMFATDGVFELEEEEALSLYPNPVASGAKLSIGLPNGSAGEVQVDVISATGVSLQQENALTNGEEVTIQLKSSIVPGIYLVRVQGEKRRWMKKLQVK